uniref:Uncharacterized protein n=1 Tax=Amphimedon queenslandica TaxID=400682 RepID=A0A1X7T672_AMPQE
YCLYSSLFLQGHMNQLSFFFSFVPFILLELFSIQHAYCYFIVAVVVF